MTERQEVIKGLEKVWDAFNHMEHELYADYVFDALALLKEQEAVEPEAEMLNEVDRLYRCPKCHKHFFYRKQKYCDQCGQAVKWDENT